MDLPTIPCATGAARPLRSVWLALLFALAVAFPGNGGARPFEEHEALAARSAEEMTRDGSIWIGRFGGTWRLEKPPLGYWLVQGAHRLLGGPRVSELQARLPSVIAAALTAALLHALVVAAWGDRRAAAVAAVLWSTSAGFATYARNARPEMVYTALCTALMLCLLRAGRAGPGTRPSLAWALLGWSAAALAVLTKGPLLPLAIGAGALIGARAGRRCTDRIAVAALHPLAGLALIAAVIGGYVLLVREHVPGALDVWRAEMFDRAGDGGPVWWRPLELYYLYSTPQLLLPWLVPLALAAAFVVRGPGVMAGSPRSGGATRLIAGAVASPALVLSFSEGRHAYYLLPVAPLLCGLMGIALVERHDRARATAEVRPFGRTLAVHAALLALISACLGVVVAREPRSPALLAAAAVLPLALACAGLAWRARKARPAASFGWLAAGLGTLQLGMGAAAVGSSPERFSRAEFAREVAARVPAEVPVVALEGSRELLIYYGDRPVPRVGAADLAAGGGALVLARQRSLEKGRLAGAVLLRERAPVGSDPMVLVRTGAASEGQVPDLDQRPREQAGDEDRVAELEGVRQ